MTVRETERSPERNVLTAASSVESFSHTRSSAVYLPSHSLRELIVEQRRFH